MVWSNECENYLALSNVFAAPKRQLESDALSYYNRFISSKLARIGGHTLMKIATVIKPYRALEFTLSFFSELKALSGGGVQKYF